MTIIVRHNGPVPQLHAHIALLRSLLSDMEAIAQGQHPGRNILNDAPLLHGWTRTARPEPCLTGIVDGHPGIGDLRPAITSGLWVLAPELGYARTLSRFYALGEPKAR